MKQKIKQAAFALAISIFCLFPQVSLAVSTIDDPNRGLVICGNGTGGSSEEAAIDGILRGEERPPAQSDTKYQNPDGTFKADLYNEDFRNYQRRQSQTEGQRAAARQASWDRYFENSCQFIDIFQQIVKLVNYGMAAAAIFFTFRIVFEGFRIVLQASEEKEVAAAKKAVTRAVIGFALVLSSYAIVNVIFQILAIQLNTSFPLNPFK